MVKQRISLIFSSCVYVPQQQYSCHYHHHHQQSTLRPSLLPPIDNNPSPKEFIYPCRGDPRSSDCLQYGTRYRKQSTEIFCENCERGEAKGRRSATQRLKSKLDDTSGKRKAANSATSFKNLSPGETCVRMASMAKDRKRYVRTTTQWLQKGLESSKSMSKFKYLDCASDLRSLITKAFQKLATLATHEKVEVKQHIIKELLGLSAGDDCEEIDEEEASDFAAYLMTEIDNKGKELSGKPNAVGFTPALVRNVRNSIVCTKNNNQVQILLTCSPLPPGSR